MRTSIFKPFPRVLAWSEWHEVNSRVHDLNSGHWFHFPEQLPLHHSYLHKYALRIPALFLFLFHSFLFHFYISILEVTIIIIILLWFSSSLLILLLLFLFHKLLATFLSFFLSFFLSLFLFFFHSINIFNLLPTLILKRKTKKKKEKTSKKLQLLLLQLRIKGRKGQESIKCPVPADRAFKMQQTEKAVNLLLLDIINPMLAGGSRCAYRDQHLWCLFWRTSALKVHVTG